MHLSGSLPTLTPVIAGPTAGGKSDLAVALALAARERLGVEAEIITADAFQIYRGMDIGTAKPTPDERRGVPHHLIDIVDAHGGPALRAGMEEVGWSASSVGSDGRAAAFTVDHWLALATAKIAELRAANKLPIVVGGTHLYIKALLDGLFDGPEPDPALRAELAEMDPAARRAELERVDPVAAARIHPNDARRTIRAIEVHRLTGRAISAHQTQWDARSSADGAGRGTASPYLLVLLHWDTEALNRRINARVRQMMDRGLLAEVRELTLGGPLAPQPAEALGYKQLLPLLGPGRPFPPSAEELAGAVERIKIETRRFAKNQRTWLRRLGTTPGALSLPCSEPPGAAEVGAILHRLSPQ